FHVFLLGKGEPAGGPTRRPAGPFVDVWSFGGLSDEHSDAPRKNAKRDALACRLMGRSRVPQFIPILQSQICSKANASPWEDCPSGRDRITVPLPNLARN